MKDNPIRIKKINYFWSISDLVLRSKMKRLATFLFIAFFLVSWDNYGQFLIPGEGIMDIKLGADWDEIEWELGFRGEKLSYEQSSEAIKLIARNADIDFDYMVRYNHIMWLPVSDLLFKDNKVCMIQLSSYPEYNQMLSADIGTTEGLNFWDTPQQISQAYGEFKSIPSGDKIIVVIKEKGLGVEISENEVRTMFIFQPK
jgi:hypothetical protein